MKNQEPNPASANDKHRDKYKDKYKEDARKAADNAAPDRRPGPAPELDGKNDSGVEPEIHGSDLPGK